MWAAFMRKGRHNEKPKSTNATHELEGELALFASATVEFYVVTRLDYVVLVKLVLALVGNCITRDAPKLAELLTNISDCLARNWSWLVIDTITNVSYAFACAGAFLSGIEL